VINLEYEKEKQQRKYIYKMQLLVCLDLNHGAFSYNSFSLSPSIAVLERARRGTKSIFKDLYQNKGIISKEDLLESYKKSLDNHFSYTQDMYDLIDQYRAAASFKNKKGIMEPATPQQIKRAVTKYGLFSNRFDQKSLRQILTNKYEPPEINRKDIRSYLKEAQIDKRTPNFDNDIIYDLRNIRNRYMAENIVKPNVFPAEGNE
tara:strand:+ start:11 stop:622 length:612 start_codon:yes stop_codon:yes gene_type:complete